MLLARQASDSALKKAGSGGAVAAGGREEGKAACANCGASPVGSPGGPDEAKDLVPGGVSAEAGAGAEQKKAVGSTKLGCETLFNLGSEGK